MSILLQDLIDEADGWLQNSPTSNRPLAIRRQRPLERLPGTAHRSSSKALRCGLRGRS